MFVGSTGAKKLKNVRLTSFRIPKVFQNNLNYVSMNEKKVICIYRILCVMTSFLIKVHRKKLLHVATVLFEDYGIHLIIDEDS